MPLVAKAVGFALPVIAKRLFGRRIIKKTILYPVPHRQYVFILPILLRIYFKYDRDLLSKLCNCAASERLLIFLRNVIGLQDGAPGVVMSIHTFGDYPEKFHSHIHAIASDGLFRKTGILLWLVFKQISWVTKKTGQSPTRRSTA